MLVTGATISAQRAYEIGLANAVVPAAELMDRAMTMAQTIAGNGPLSVRASKRAVIEGEDLPLEEGIQLEQRLSKALFSSHDAAEGPRAFAEKRPPRFEGR
jgi:enoyl-CoA hydratase/carnithine racemase